MTKAKLIVALVFVAFASSICTVEIINNSKPTVAESPTDAYFTENVFSDEQPAQRTIEAMVQRCESAEIILKAAGGQIMPTLRPMSTQDQAKRLMEIGVCLGSLSTFIKIKFPGKICLPTRPSTPLQAVRIFLEWARNHPEKLEENFMVGYLEAYEKAFPCPSKL